mgnify:CR=1 FL=1
MPSKKVWTWDGHAYHGPNGRFVGPKQMLELRDAFSDATVAEARRLTAEVPNGQEMLGTWLVKMRELTKQTYIDQYVLGRGGRAQMTQSDWGKLGALVKRQYQFLQGMAYDAAAGTMTGAQMEARAGLYARGANAAYEMASASAAGIPRLPCYPADGNSVCKSNCKCTWDIVALPDRWEATWVLGEVDKHCPDCVSHANTWNPLVIPRGAA